ncbi:tRNA 5-(aminomethyl)-2-thiouridylate-methyltransferase MnmM [Clostridium sp. DL1XJH146]
MYFSNAMNIARDYCHRFINEGDIVVDATVGNGNDTALLCKLVGSSGKVYGFDVQEEALRNAEAYLKELNLDNRVRLILDGHENIKEYICEKVDVVIFNLGYLPKGNHEITTKWETTIKAISGSMDLIKKEGKIFIVVYPGHSEGEKEKKEIEEFVKTISQKEYNVAKISFMNQINNPPFLIAIEKRKL